MFPEARSGRTSSVQARPLAELLECPAEIGNLLNGTARCIDVDVGEVVFRQSETCGGLYVVVSGQFLRRAERLETRLNLGVVRAGCLVELAAALGDGLHTYTLTAQVAGSVLLLPIGALNRALENFPPLRMRLLEELAREVSRGYEAGRRDLASNSRQRSFSVSSAQA
jgi:CRP-like cAMP-binding protein